MTNGEPRTGVLFVCLGNICRSPLAEGIFIHLARERGVLDRLLVDSAGTGGWHVGNPADPRSIAVARKHGIHLPSRARTFDDGAAEAERFRWLIAMDKQNQRDMIARGAPRESVHLMLNFHPSPPADEVPDPYYDEDEGFDRVYEMLVGACEGLLDAIT
ncbi:MAG: low molecular weight protein-tyrosine-phosphatase [Phycisphaerales bacterium]